MLLMAGVSRGRRRNREGYTLTMTVREEGPVPTVQRPFLDLFLQTVHAFHKTESLKAAIQLDVFTAIGEGADTEEISRRCKASARGIRILCDFLVMIGFLEKE